VARLFQRVDDPDKVDLGVLALVALLAARLWVFESAQASCKALGSLGLALGLAAPSVLGRRDHRSTAPVHLDDDDSPIVVGDLRGIEKRFGLSTDSVDHAQR
jgi:hypothetical protein